MPLTTEWQRVSPVAIVFFLLSAIPSLVHLWPVVLGMLAAGESGRAILWTYGLPGLAALLLLSATLQYLFFRFKVDADRLQLQTGVLHRKRLTLDFERVQQADITRPFYFRPLGLAILGLESAGSSQQEVDLPGIPLATAEPLRQQIMAQARTPTADPDPQGDAPGPSLEYELRLPVGEVARYGLMHNGLLFLAPLAAPLSQYMGPTMESALAWIQQLPLMRAWEAAGTTDTFLIYLSLALVSILLGIVLLFGISAGLALVYYWDYHLIREGDRFQARSGLGTQRTRSFRVRKLQKVTLAQGMIARALRRYTLAISKAGGSVQGNVNDKQRFIVPVLTEGELRAMRAQLELPTAQWQRVHPLRILDATLRMGTLLAILSAGFLLASNPSVTWALLAYPVVAAMAWRNWHQYGYDLPEGWLAVRQGFIGHKEQWLPTGKLQKLKLSRPLVLRLLGLAHLTVWSTDGPLVVSYLPEAIAAELHDRLLADITQYQKPWF